MTHAFPQNRDQVVVARVWLRLLGFISFLAFASFGQQAHVLVGSRGLLPVADLAQWASVTADLGLLELPTLFRWFASDLAIQLVVASGGGLSLAAAFGIAPRLCLAAAIPLYLSIVVGGRDFMAFQWDNMLIECLLLGALLPRNKRAPFARWMLRLLLFKLYFESGIAKWQSYRGDWHDGSAMGWYYETAPIAGLLGWWAHHLPAGWHVLESWGALVLELLIPFFVFGPKAARLVAFAAFTGFQLLNLATANYGFFVYLSLSLHLFLLDDGDLARLAAWTRRCCPDRLVSLGLAWPRMPTKLTQPVARRHPGVLVVMALVTVVYVGHSAALGVQHFTRPPGQCHPKRLRCTERPDALQAALDVTEPYRGWIDSLRLVHAYHLFGHITVERIEPQFETRSDGAWTEHHMRYKAGPVDRAPTVIAPHQPRVDFRLWFYGLGFGRGMPRYVDALLERLCADPSAVQPLFDTSLPSRPGAVRIRFWRYRFTSPQQRQKQGNWWQRDALGSTRALDCSHVRASALDTLPTRLDDRLHGSHLDRRALQDSCAPRRRGVWHAISRIHSGRPEVPADRSAAGNRGVGNPGVAVSRPDASAIRSSSAPLCAGPRLGQRQRRNALRCR